MKDIFKNLPCHSWQIECLTKNRQSFTQVPIILASAINREILTQAGNKIEILILDHGGMGKSLIADSMIYALYDYWDEECIPISNKMCLEVEPVEASREPKSVTDHIDGQDVDIYFYSNHSRVRRYIEGDYDIDTIYNIDRTNRPTLFFLTGSLYTETQNPTGIKIKIKVGNRLNQWSRIWNIEITDPRLQTKTMLKALKNIQSNFDAEMLARRPKFSKPAVI